MVASSFTWGDLAYLALAVFLVVVGVSLGYAFLRLGETFGRLSAFIRGTERELLPVITKVGGTAGAGRDQLTDQDRNIHTVGAVPSPAGPGARRPASLSLTPYAASWTIDALADGRCPVPSPGDEWQTTLHGEGMR